MEKNNDRLKIHTSVKNAPGDAGGTGAQEQPGWEVLPHPAQKGKRRRASALSIGERLIRNTAIAGALMLCVLAVRNIEAPWSEKAVEGIKQAVTMRVDWGERLGKLSFVRALVPETALVFLNMSDGEMFYAPVGGEITHDYTQEQPWLEYACTGGESVLAASGGRVRAAAQSLGGDWVVMLEHENAETTYGYLADATVQVGQMVEAGDVLGHAASAQGRIYFEMREGDASVDPTQRLAP